MQGNWYFQLIAPTVFMVFAIGFGAIYIFDRKKNVPLVLAASYTFMTVGFTLDVLRPFLDLTLAGLFSNIAYALGVAAFVVAISLRYRKRLLLLPVAMLCLAWASGWLYFTLVQDDIEGRIFVANFSAGALVIWALCLMLKSRWSTIDKILFALMSLNAAQLFIRTAISLAIVGDTLTKESYSTSVVALSMFLTSATIALMLAVTLFFALGMDTVISLRKRSETDHMTGTLNRHGYETGVEDTLQKAERSSLPISLIVADIDHFKKVNDTFGHAVGDIVIIQFGSLLKKATRKVDVVGRIGGEEFCILLWNCNATSARTLAEGMRTQFNTQEFEGIPQSKKLSASFGVAEWTIGMSYDALFARADSSLYEAKQSGRNKVCINLDIKPQSSEVHAA